MRSWSEFESAVPEFAAAARMLFVGSDGIAIGFLSTASRLGSPHLAPVCPIFSGTDLYLSAVTRTPKVQDLRDNPVYVLHSFLGPADEEFQIHGRADEVRSPTERKAVLQAIRFGSFDPNHTIFRLSIGSTLWVYWDKPGQPDTKAIRKRWSHDSINV